MAVTRTSAAGAQSWSTDTVSLSSGAQPVQLCAANGDRAGVMVTNDAASTGTVWVNPGSGTTKGGFPIAPGASFKVATVAPVYGYAAGGAATVYVVSEYGTVC